MFCTKCGSNNKDGSMFCCKCGAPLKNKENDSTAKPAGSAASDPHKNEKNTKSENTGIESIYMLGFLKKILTRTGNIPLILYMIANVFIISVGIQMASIFFSESGNLIIDPFDGSVASNWVVQQGTSLLLATVLYLVSIAIALSPVGEFVLRFQNQCEELERQEHMDYILPIFNRVLAKARQKDPSISQNVKLFVCDKPGANAFALGRHTICITYDLLEESEDRIEALLGHEMGHLSSRDTDLILMVSVGNLVVTAIVWVVNVAILIFEKLSRFFSEFGGFCVGLAGAGLLACFFGRMISAFFKGLCFILSMIIVKGFYTIWVKIGFLIVQKANRDNEYYADEFCYHLGYGNELCEAIDHLFVSTNEEGLFAALSQSHPDKNSRIARLQNLGATYRG